MEHWARQQIVQAIIMAEVKCLNSKGKALAVPAGEAADEILDLLFDPPKYKLEDVK